MIERLILCLFVATGASVQTRGQAQPPATPHRIVLPPHLLAGQPATLAVIALDGRVAPFAVVNLPDGKQVTTDESGRARFIAPAGEGAFLAKLPGSDQMAAAAVIKAATGSRLTIDHAPRFVSLHDYFPVYGTAFRGEADQDVASVGGQIALVLASSPASLVVLPAPETPVGTANIAVAVGGKAQAAALSVINVDFFTTPARITPGKKIRVTVRALGTERPLDVEVRNLAPKIVRLPGHGKMTVKTSGGPENNKTFEAQAISAGNFSFAADLAMRSGPPDIIAARQFIQAAVAITTPQVRKQLLGVAERIEKHPKDAVKATGDLEKLSADSSDREVGFWIAAAIDSLRGKP